MKYFHLPIALLLLTALASAQAFTSPPGYLTKEGGSMAIGFPVPLPGFVFFPASYADARYQFADGEWRGKGLKVIRSMGYRLDFRNHTTNSTMGRKWTDVTLSVSETNIPTLTRTWTKNPTTTPTQVFRGAVTFPTQVGTPGTAAPAPWDKRLAFPFRSPWRYSSRQDMLHDFVFRGGTLANRAAWTGATQQFYYLDGIMYVQGVWTGGVGFPRTSPCRDPAAKLEPYGPFPARAQVAYGQFSKAFTTIPAWAGMVVLNTQTHQTAPNAPVIQALGLAGLKNGVGTPFPGSCHNLIVDLSKGAFYIFAFADVTGKSRLTAIIAGPHKTINSISGLQIWTQGAWVHSKTGLFTLTRAERTQAPSVRVNDTFPNKKVIYSHTTGPTGWLDWDLSVIRYN